MKAKKPATIRVWCVAPAAVFWCSTILMLLVNFSIWLAIGAMPEFPRLITLALASEALSLVVLKYAGRLFTAVEFSRTGLRRCGFFSKSSLTPWRQLKRVQWRRDRIHLWAARVKNPAQLELSPWINDVLATKSFLSKIQLAAPSTRQNNYHRARFRMGIAYALFTILPIAALLALSNSMKCEQFALAAFTGHTPALRFWLLAGLDPNTPLVRANALMVAAMANQLAAIELLLQNGAKVNLPSPDGITPLQIAAAKSSVETVRILLLYGADPAARLPDGRPLYRAVKDAGDRRIASLLDDAMKRQKD